MLLREVLTAVLSGTNAEKVNSTESALFCNYPDAEDPRQVTVIFIFPLKDSLKIRKPTKGFL